MATRERKLDKDSPIIQHALKAASILCDYYGKSELEPEDAYVSAMVAGAIIATGIAKLNDTPEMSIIAHNLHNAERATEFTLDIMKDKADFIEAMKNAIINKGK